MFRAFALGLFAACAASFASAQTAYPTRPITIVVPYPAGGSIDLVAREVGEKLRLAWGQPVIVQNVGGASGNIGTAQVARAAPDGYSILLTTNAPLVLNRFVMKDVSFDALSDFEPIIVATVTPIALAVHQSQPFQGVSDLIDYARANPGKIGYASSGTGSPHHLSGELLRSVAGIDIRHVPYRGASPAINDLVGGHVPAGFVTLGLILPQAKAGSVKILAVIDDTRSELAPDVPTVAETIPAYRNAPTGWHAFLAPRGTPPDIVQKLNEEIERALADAATRARLHSVGILVAGGKPADVTARIKAETDVVRRLVDKIGLKPE